MPVEMGSTTTAPGFASGPLDGFGIVASSKVSPEGSDATRPPQPCPRQVAGMAGRRKFRTQHGALRPSKTRRTDRTTCTAAFM